MAQENKKTNDRKNLTVKMVENAKAGTARIEIADALVPGLRLVIQPRPSGAKSWAVRYRFKGQPCKLTLGSFPGLTLEAARSAAQKALRTVAEGGDPREAKRRAAETDADTFAAVAHDFLVRYNGKKRPLREATRNEYARILGFRRNPENPRKWVQTGDGVAAAWGKKPIRDITRRQVRDLLDGYVDRGSPVMANRVLATVRKLFNWAQGRDYVESSPCEGIDPPGAENARDRQLSDEELRLVWKATERLGKPFGPVIQLLALTLQRRDEVGEMRRGEWNSDKSLWTIPGERVKNGQAHEVPLSAPALEILRNAPSIGRRRDGLMFTTNGETPLGGYSKFKERLDAEILKVMQEEASQRGDNPKKVKPIPRWTFHDLRRTGASGMARLGINLPVIEKVLNHTSGSFKGIVSVYQRHDYADEKRKALDEWGDFIMGLVTDEDANNAAAAQAAQ